MVFPRAGSQAAQSFLMDSDQLSAPALVRIEVYAAITRKVRLGEIAPEGALKACELWAGAIEKGVLALVADEDVIPAAIDVALKLAHPLQDCLYLVSPNATKPCSLPRTESSTRGRRGRVLRLSFSRGQRRGRELRCDACRGITWT